MNAGLRLNHMNWQGLLNEEEESGVLEEMNVEELKALLLAIREELKQIRSAFEEPPGPAKTISSGNA